jgi:hypothetical protein
MPNTYYGSNVYYNTPRSYYNPRYSNYYSPQAGWNYYGAPMQYGNGMPSGGVTIEQR